METHCHHGPPAAAAAAGAASRVPEVLRSGRVKRGRKERNCRDHIFVVNGIIQDALSSKSSKGIDLFICDYRTMFDGLDVKTTLNDLYDNGVQDDNFALI